MLDLDHTQSGSDLDINYLYDESDSYISDLDDDSIVTEEPPTKHIPIESHMEKNEPVYQSKHKKRKGHPEPIER